MELHPQTKIATRFGEAHVDAEIAPLLERLHFEGIRTSYSCQGAPTPLPELDPSELEYYQSLLDQDYFMYFSDIVATLRDQVGKTEAYILFPTLQDGEAFLALATELSVRTDDEELLIRIGAANSYLPVRQTGDMLADLQWALPGGWSYDCSPQIEDRTRFRLAARFPNEDLLALSRAL